jgi:hypothetical protein
MYALIAAAVFLLALFLWFLGNIFDDTEAEPFLLIAAFLLGLSSGLFLLTRFVHWVWFLT